MPWVRIDEHAMEHPKVAGLPDGAFRLWVTGLSYCQKFLTDGFIVETALRGLRAFSPKRRVELVTSGLWQNIEGGVSVHDYLDWNESRDHVVNARQQARERLKKHKDKRVSNDSGNAHPTVTCVSGDSGSFEEIRTEEGLGETVARVQRFIDTYRAKHLETLDVAYLGNDRKDYEAAGKLVEAFDDNMLLRLMQFWFHSTDAFATNGTRTVTKFLSRASRDAEELKARKLA